MLFVCVIVLNVYWGEGFRPLNGCLQTRCLLVFLYAFVSVNIILNWEVTAECCSATWDCSVQYSFVSLCYLITLFIIELLFEFARLIL